MTLLWLCDGLIVTHILLVFVTHQMTIMTKNMIATATLNKYDHEMGMMKTWSKSWQSQPDEEHDGTSNVEPGEVDEVGDEPVGGGVGGPDGSHYLEIGGLTPILASITNFHIGFLGLKKSFFWFRRTTRDKKKRKNQAGKYGPKKKTNRPKSRRRTWGRSIAQQILIRPWWEQWLLICPSWCRQEECTKCRQMYQM